MGRPLLRALVTEEHVALVEPHRPGQLLLPDLRALEPELRVRIRHRGRGGEGRVRRVGRRRGRREGGVAGRGGGHEEAEW